MHFSLFSYPAVSAECSGGLELRCLLINGNGLILNLLPFFFNVLPFGCSKPAGGGWSELFAAVPLTGPWCRWPQFNDINSVV